MKIILTVIFRGFLAVILIGPASVVAQIPTRITEHLWSEPGPEQSEPGAPRVLIVYPLKKEPPIPFGQEATRFAGRVDPADAEVKINGVKVVVFPGGVFTGLIPIRAGRNIVEFNAESGGKTTTVVREIVRNEKPDPPARWPLEFRKGGAVSPSGRFGYWLRTGSRMKIKVLGSPGHTASLRFGETGGWLVMSEVQATQEQGGAYEIEIAMDDSFPTSEQRLEFKLEGSEQPGGEVVQKTLKSDLKIRRLAMDEVLVGEITADFATFLKNPEGWERYGNWNKGTRFPVWEWLSDRVSVNFAGGDSGYIEVEAMKLLEKGAAYAPPDLSRMSVELSDFQPDTMRMEFDASGPPPSVFVHESSETSDRLTLRLPGPVKVSAGVFRQVNGVEHTPTFSVRQISVVQNTDLEPAKVVFDMVNRRLWGYGWNQPQKGRWALTVALKPSGRERMPPLEGWKIMVDAGHGGGDTGALGPSGLREADVNLVVAGFLADELARRGATIRHTRTADVKVELDDRVRMAEKFGADLFISVHHNSVAMSTDPLRDKGPKLFYHYPHSLPLAEELEARLVNLMTPGEKPRVLKEVFRVMRNITFCPSVLVEGGFVCHPEDELRLRDTEFLRKMGTELAEGVQALLAGHEEE